LRTRPETSSLERSRLRAGTNSNSDGAPGRLPQNHSVLFDPDNDPRANRVTDLDHTAIDERKTTVLIDQNRVYSRQGFSEQWYRWWLRRRSDCFFIGRTSHGLLRTAIGRSRLGGRCTIRLAPALRGNRLRD